jgi:4-hydroxy-3-methylbut-2-enyl diphosphate reductase
VDLVLAELRRSRGPFRIYGPLVHNPLVQEALEEKGVRVCTDPSCMESGVLFLRTHGTPPEELAVLEHLPVRIRDLTCPRVARALRAAVRRREEGRSIVILGDPDHQEVRALRSYGGGDSAHVIQGPGDVAGLPALERPFLLSQTTQDETVFERTAAALSARFPDLETENTICESTRLRQEELRSLCPRADCAVVVGGRESANTARLAGIAAGSGLPVFRVERADEIEPGALSGFRRILLAAGASTPSWSIRQVLGRLQALQGSRRAFAFSAIRGMVFSNLHLLLAAMAIGTAGGMVAGRSWLLPSLASSLILFALLNINSILEAGFSRVESEERQVFVRRHGRSLAIQSSLALAAAAAASALLPPLFGLVYAGSMVLFAVYSSPLLAGAQFPPGGLRAVPGSRDILFALGWAVLLAVLPAAGAGTGTSPAGTAAWSVQLLMLFLGRSILLDLVDLQGDALMGRDTIPLALGTGRSRLLLYAAIAVPAALLAAAAAAGLLPAPALGAAAGHLWLGSGYLLLRRSPFPSELSARIAGDGSLLAAGLAALLAVGLFSRA